MKSQARPRKHIDSNGEKYFVLYHFTFFSNMVACYQEGPQKKACFPIKK